MWQGGHTISQCGVVIFYYTEYFDVVILYIDVVILY